MPFRNLYFELSWIRDHNFCDFLGRLEEVSDDFLEAKYREGYFERGIEPYFDPIIPLTLHPTACAGFFRTGPKWPITERDYYLSKLFQFLFVPIQIKYELDYQIEDTVRERLEEILDQISHEVLPELHRWDWWDFYDDTFHLELDALLERLDGRLEEFCRKVQQGRPPKSHAEEGTPVLRRRRRRQRPAAERDSVIVRCLSQKMDRFEICRILDQRAIPTTPGLQAKGIYRWTEAWTNLDRRNLVQQIFTKALNKEKRVKP